MLTRKLLGIILFSIFSLNVTAQNPYTMPDQAWMSLSGTIVSTTEDTFRLDYGDGIITVEMDDWDSFNEAYALKDGDKVTVYGRVDDDLYEITTIEASSVYVENLNTYFYANSADEEDLVNWSVSIPIQLSEVTYVGTVSEVNPLLGTFIIGDGNYEMEVDVSPLPYDPLDKEGFQRIEKGDKVRVNGYITNDFFTGRELNAESVITLEDASASS